MQKVTSRALAVFTALALAALASAPVALAQDQFEAESYPATVSGQPIGKQQLITTENFWECSLSLASEPINAPSATLTATPSGSCEGAFGVTKPLEANGCKVILNPDWDTYSIGPKGCGPITVKTTCELTIPAQSGLAAEYQNVGGSPETVEFTSTATDLAYSHPDAGCTGPAVKASDGDLLGSWTLKANGSSDLRVGEESTTGFEAESYPATFSGSSIYEMFVMEGGSVECVGSFTGSASGASNTLSLAPTFTNCKAFGFAKATVSSNGCELVYQAGGSNSMGIACAPGNAIVVTAGNCTVQIGSQSGLTSVSYENIPISGRQGISIKPNVKGISYTVAKDGFLCPFAGTGPRTGGTYGGAKIETRVQGFDSEGTRQNIRQGN